jgi:transcription elongation factor Elf1
VGFSCIYNNKECDGCMNCQPETHYYCPICGHEVYETVFVDNSGEVIGCENCAQIKEPHEVLENETD